MNKNVSILIVVLVVLVGVYLFWTTKSSDNGSNALKQDSSTAVEENSLTVVTKGPIGVATGALGEYLVDKNGLTLSVSIRDENPTGKISQSCNSQCEKTWLPFLLAKDEAAITGSKDPLLSKLNLFTRSDKQEQYAIGTQPLYRYVGDLKAGDTKGDTGGDWKIAKP